MLGTARIGDAAERAERGGQLTAQTKKKRACIVYTGLARSTPTAWQAAQGASETFVPAARPALSPCGGSELGAVDLERGRPAHGVGGLAVARQLRDGDARGLARGKTSCQFGRELRARPSARGSF